MIRGAPKRILATLAALTVALSLTACGGLGWAGGSGNAVRVLMVNNPQMVDLQKLAGTFTQQTGIKVDFTVLPENDLRDKASLEFASQAGQYDVATLSNFEIPFYSKNNWLTPMDDYIAKDPGFDQADVLKPIALSLTGPDRKIYGEPFYGESSFLMYRKDVFAAKGLTVPDHPTWNQIADLAAKVGNAQPGMRGICLRGQPGWGQVMAPVTTVVNTFGGTWFEKDWTAKVNAPEFKQAVNFYVNLIKAHGEPGASQAGFTECLNAMSQSKVAMWYDATSAAGSLEDPSVSKVAGKVGYVQAPVVKTKASGWLWTWAFVEPKTTKNADAASKYMLWATGKDYEKLVGQKLGWARVPAGKRKSTYSIPEYKKASAAFGQQTLPAIEEANPENPGVQPRPTVGVQFVDIPEFQDLGTKVSQDIAAAIAGRGTVDDALNKGQTLAEQV